MDVPLHRIVARCKGAIALPGISRLWGFVRSQGVIECPSREPLARDERGGRYGDMDPAPNEAADDVAEAPVISCDT